MKQQPRILYFDDRPEDLETLQDTLELEGYIVETFWVKSAEDLDDLKYRLCTEWWHLVIADVALLGSRDEWGLQFVLESDAIVPKVIWTAYPEWQRPGKALPIPDGQSLPPAIKFISKLNDNAKEELVEAIKSALYRDSHYRINYSLDICIDEGLFQSLATRIKVVHQGVREASQEIEDLVRKLFPTESLISITHLPFQPSSGVLIHVNAEDEYGILDSLVVHLDNRDAIRRVKSNNQKFLWRCKHAARSRSVAETLHYAGLVYSIEGRPTDFLAFERMFIHAPENVLEAIVERLFTYTLKPLYEARRVRAATTAFDESYRRALELETQPDRFAHAVTALLISHPLVRRKRDYSGFFIPTTSFSTSIYHPETSDFELVDPAEVIFFNDNLFNLAEPAEEGIIYGDLTEKMLLIGLDNGIWLPGSHKTGRGFYLRDFIALEASIMLKLIVRLSSTQSIEDPLLLQALWIWLTPNSLDEQLLPATRDENLLNSEYGKALATVSHIRRQARNLGEANISHYYGGLLFHAAQLVLESKKPRVGSLPVYYAHAALASALLATRLTKPWPEPQNVIRLDESRNRVYVPHSGEWIKLTNNELKLIKILLRFPNQVVSISTIKELVWPYGGGDVSNLVGRVRDKIEPDRRNPCYIITHARRGFEIRPDGHLRR